MNWKGVEAMQITISRKGYSRSKGILRPAVGRSKSLCRENNVGLEQRKRLIYE